MAYQKDIRIKKFELFICFFINILNVVQLTLYEIIYKSTVVQLSNHDVYDIYITKKQQELIFYLK